MVHLLDSLFSGQWAHCFSNCAVAGAKWNPRSCWIWSPYHSHQAPDTTSRAFSSAASTLPLACTAGQSTLSLKEECSKVVDGLLWAWSMTTLLSLTQHLVVTYHSVNQHMPPVFPGLRKPHRAELTWSVCFSQIPTLLINSAASPSKKLSGVSVTWN